MINLTYEDREELIIAAATGAVLGFVGGYYLDHSRGFGILVWVIVCAVIASGMVYCLRASCSLMPSPRRCPEIAPRSAAELKWRIAANIAKLPELLTRR